MEIRVNTSEKGVLVGRGVKHVDVFIEIEGSLTLPAELIIVGHKSRVKAKIFLIWIAATAIVGGLVIRGLHIDGILSPFILEGPLEEVLPWGEVVLVMVVFMVEVWVIIHVLVSGSYDILIESVSLVAFAKVLGVHHVV